MGKIKSIIEKEIEKQFKLLSEDDKNAFEKLLESPTFRWQLNYIAKSSPRELFSGEKQFEKLVKKGNNAERAANTAIYNSYKELQKLLREE